ncbi:hypothetical protein GCM10017778_02760 [Streptomyces vinaceus]|nr:hypothetical protein GCM10017778_02760 [Streptomyces vinaceus]
MRRMLSRPADPVIKEPVQRSPRDRNLLLARPAVRGAEPRPPGTGARRIAGLVREDGLPAESAAAADPGVAAGKGPAEGQERSHN